MNKSLLSFKHRITSQTVMAFLLIIFGMVIVMISLYMPPQGEIHPTVITIFGMVVVAGGAYMGIDLNFQLKQFLDLKSDKNKKQDENS